MSEHVSGLVGSTVSASVSATTVPASTASASTVSASTVPAGAVVPGVGVFAVGGALAAWAVCLALARSRSPAAVPPGLCVVATGAVWAWLAWRAAVGGLPWWWLPVPLVVTAVAVPLAAADLRYRRLPDVVTLPAVPLVLAAVVVAAVSGPGDGVDTGLVVGAVAGVVAFAGAHLLVRFVVPGSLGAGDVKLAAALGGALGAVGWPALVVAACLASLVTLAVATTAAVTRVVRAVRTAGWRFCLVAARGNGGVPHGPGLLLGACLVATFPGAGTGAEMGVVTSGIG